MTAMKKRKKKLVPGWAGNPRFGPPLKAKKPPTAYVLKSWDGKYFEQMTGIGPALTGDIRKAHSFASREDAAFHPAARHTLCMFSVEEVTP